MSKNIINNKDEIDLIEVILIVRKRILSVILFSILAIIITFFLKSLSPTPKLVAISEIKPITVFDDAKYQIYNSIVKSITSTYLRTPSYITKKLKEDKYIDIMQDIEKSGISNFEIFNEIERDWVKFIVIDKSFLFNLFIDLIQEKIFLQNTLEKFGFIKRENYLNDIEYKRAINDVVNSIELENINQNIEIKKNKKKLPPVYIKFETADIEKVEKFLKYYEKEMNLKIHKKIKDMFDSYVYYINTIKKFEIDDIDDRLNEPNLAQATRIQLENRKETILGDNYLEKIEFIFSNSPFDNQELFYAAKFDSKSVENTNANDKSSDTTVFFIAGLLGALLGIFYVLLANAVKKRQ